METAPVERRTMQMQDSVRVRQEIRSGGRLGILKTGRVPGSRVEMGRGGETKCRRWILTTAVCEIGDVTRVGCDFQVLADKLVTTCSTGAKKNWGFELNGRLGFS